MSLQDVIESDLKIFFSTEEFAQKLTYAPKGGASIDIDAVFRPGKDIDDSKWQAAVQASGQLWIKASDVAAPGYGDTVTIGSDTWTVVNIDRVAQDSIWRLDIRRDLRPTFRK